MGKKHNKDLREERPEVLFEDKTELEKYIHRVNKKEAHLRKREKQKKERFVWK